MEKVLIVKCFYFSTGKNLKQGLMVVLLDKVN